MIDERFIFLTVVLELLGTLSYLLDTIKGKVQPNKVTWFLWALAPLIAFIAQINKGVGLSAIMTFMVGFGPLLIFIASFVNKKSQWKITGFDIICGILSLLGLALWGLTKEGNVGIFFAILADGLAAIPTLIKSYKAPDTESSTGYLLYTFSGIVTLLTIKQWDFAHLSFPAYITLICFIFYVLVKFKLGKRI